MVFQSVRASLIVGLVIVLTIGVHCVSAAVGCAAEANFQGCKTIEETQLKSCGPSDYVCQCAAQKLIQQCYNLCPTYASDATIQQGTVDGICAAVPVTTTSLAPLPTSTTQVAIAPTVVHLTSSAVSIKSALPTASTTHAATSSGCLTHFMSLHTLSAVSFIVVWIVWSQ
ncbi:hypothetical protein BDF14DRAFT_1877296 [Spinellus fusiger]|nr:hypothetical protein BDF14DRAFT_1877296 [Spinellus fusiger]